MRVKVTDELLEVTISARAAFSKRSLVALCGGDGDPLAVVRRPAFDAPHGHDGWPAPPRLRLLALPLRDS